MYNDAHLMYNDVHLDVIHRQSRAKIYQALPPWFFGLYMREESMGMRLT